MTGRRDAEPGDGPAPPRTPERGDPGMRRRCGSACRAGARWALYASVLTPLFYSTDFIYPFVVPAALWFRLTVSVAGVLAAGAALTGAGRLRVPRDPVLAALGLYLLVAVLSAAAGEAPLHSFFGSYERMGGVVMWVHYVAYYLLLRLLLDGRGWARYLTVLVVTATVLAAAGAFQAHGGGADIHPLLRINRVQATMGNPGFLSVFLLFGLGGCVLLARRSEGWAARIALTGAGLLQAWVLLQAAIRTSLVALFAGVVVAAVVLAVRARTDRRRRWGRRLTVAAVAVAAVLVLARDSQLVRSIPTVEAAAETRLDEPSVQTRLIAWRAGAAGIRRAPLLGAGPENFRLIYERHLDPGIHQLHGRPPRFDEAHNEYLEAAAETGLLGGLAFLLVWGALFRRVGAAGDPDGRLEAALLAGCFVAYAVFLLTWFRTPGTFGLFLGLAAYSGATLGAGGGASPEGGPPDETGSRWLRIGTASGALVLALAAAAHTVALVAPARALADAGRAGDLPTRVEQLEKAVERRVPGTVEVALEYGVLASDLEPPAVSGAGNPEIRAAGEQAYRSAARVLEAEIRRDPGSARLRALAAHVMFNRYGLGGDSAHLERAIGHARHAADRSPARPRYRRMLGELLMTAGRPERALASLREAASVLEEQGELHYEMAKVHAVEGRIEIAERQLLRADSLGWEPEQSNRPVYARVARALLAAGDTARAQQIVGLAGGQFTFE